MTNKNSDVAYVRRSTLILSVIIALLLGLYLGTLIHSFGSFATPTDGSSAGSGQNSALEAEIAKALNATKNDPQNAKAWATLGNLYYDNGNATESVKAYTKSLEIEPNNANILTDRGTMYRELGKYDLALESYNRASKINPSHKNSLFNAGIVLYYDLGRKAEGIEKWEQLLRMDPNAKAPNGEALKIMIDNLR